MAAPHYIAQKVGNRYVLVRQDVGCELEFLVAGGLCAAVGLTRKGIRRGILVSSGVALMAAGLARAFGCPSSRASAATVRGFGRGPSYRNEDQGLRPRQKPADSIDEASMESFPASDPPAH